MATVVTPRAQRHIELLDRIWSERSGIVGWLTTNDLRADLMAHCLDLDPGFHETHPPGELIERIDGDLTGLSVFFAEFLLNVVGSLLLLVLVLIVVTVQNPFAGAVFAPYGQATEIEIDSVAD